MCRVPLAEAAVLLHLDTIGMRLLILCGIIIAVLALRAGQGDSRAHGTSFPVFAVKTLLGDVKHFFRDKLSGVRVSRSLMELAGKINQTREAMTAELMRAPYLDELADRLHLPMEELVEAMEAANTLYPVSFDQSVSGEDEEITLSNYLGSEEAGYDRVEMQDWFSRIMAGLSIQEREVIRQRYELGYSQRQVASNLNVSQMYVSRLERKILSMLRNKT